MTSTRKFCCDDLFRFNNVNLDVLTETYNMSFYLQYLSKWPDYFLVQEDPNNTIMGYIMGKAEGYGENWHGHVTAVTVAPEFRRLRLAKKLMDSLENVSENLYDGYFVDLFVRVSNSLAIGMYEKLGYSVYRRVLGYYSNETDGEDAFAGKNLANCSRGTEKPHEPVPRGLFSSLVRAPHQELISPNEPKLRTRAESMTVNSSSPTASSAARAAASPPPSPSSALFAAVTAHIAPPPPPPPPADANDTSDAATRSKKALERASQIPLEVVEAIKAFKARGGIELKPPKSNESSIILDWGVRFTYLVNGEEQMGWKCLASQGCREEASFIRMFSGKTSRATKHLKEVHCIPSSQPRAPMSGVHEAIARMQREEQWRPHALPNGDDEDADDWVQNLNLTSAARFTPSGFPMTHKPRILVLDGSIRERNFSRLLAYECARILDYLGAHVRVFNPWGLPVCDPAATKKDPKVLELNTLAEWSEGHVWVSTEMQGQLSAAMKNQLDWLPATTSSERSLQGKTVAMMQVADEAAQSLSAVNSLRLLALSMSMSCLTNSTCVPNVSREFDEYGRMKPGAHRDSVVDIMEEFFKFTLVFREHASFFSDRFSGRKRKEASRYESFESEAEERRAFSRASHHL